MSNISVAEILKMHGKWIETSKFTKFVADKLKVTERHAYNLIKKAWGKNEIIKVRLKNSRNVLNGLAEFGPLNDPSTEEGLHSCEYLSAYEFLLKNERIMFGFVKECPKPEMEIVEYLESAGMTRSVAIDLLNKAAQARKIFRIKKDGTIFYRFNDFPDNINAILTLLEVAIDTEPWTRLLIDKLRYNIITSFPKYDLKRIVQATAIEVQLTYQQFLNQVSKATQEVIKEVFESISKQISKISQENLKSVS